MGSHGCLYTSNLHSGETPGAVVWRMELAAEAAEVVDDLSPRNLYSLENATPTHRTRVPPFQLATLKMKPSFPFTLGLQCGPGFVQSALAGLVPLPLRLGPDNACPPLFHCSNMCLRCG